MYTTMVNLIALDSHRNAAIASHVARVHRAGRKVLVLSERIAQLNELCKILTNTERTPREQIGFYVGSSTPTDRAMCTQCSIMMSTYQMAREGLDQKHLTALCLASPTSDVVQAVGRVQRDSGRERQGPPPLILDTCDTFSVFENQARKRRNFFKRSGFTMQRWVASSGAVCQEGGTGCELFV